MSISQIEANKATIRKLVDAHNRQDASAAAALWQSAATNHGRVAGSTGMERVYKSLYATFPDFHWEIEAILGDGDWIALHVTQTGTHLGAPEMPVLGGLIHSVAPTGKRVSVPNIHLFQIDDGLIVRHSAVRDDLGMMQQMGLLPATQHAAGDMSRPAR
jgi:predicted ester cyclase